MLVYCRCSEMITLQQSLVGLCDKAKSKWQKMDSNVTMVTNSDDNYMDIHQAIHYIAHHLKFQKKVSHYLTVSAKISHFRTKTKIHFIAQDHSYAQELSIHCLLANVSESAFLERGSFIICKWLSIGGRLLNILK